MKKIFLLIAATCALASCKGFLEEESKSEMTTEYYNTEAGLKSGVAAAYATARNVFQANMYLLNVVSDITEIGTSDKGRQYGRMADPTSTMMKDLFSDFHQGVMIANRVESVILETPKEDLTAVQVTSLAELRCLRAMYYQYMVELWGKYGHYQDKVYTTYDDAMLHINQISVLEYYEHILTDLKFAIENLPATQSDFGRFTQGAAKAIKAKALLAIAGYTSSDYAGQEEHNIHTKLGYSSLADLYTEAQRLAQSVINDYNYSLCPKWEDNFDEGNQKNSEVIWSVQWTQNLTFNDNACYIHRFGCCRPNYTLTMTVKDGVTTVKDGSFSVYRNMNGKVDKYSLLGHSMYYGREYRYVMPSYKWIQMFDDKDKRKLETFETCWLRLDDAIAPPADMTDTVRYMPLRAITKAEEQQHSDWVASKDVHAYYLDGLNEVYDLDNPNDPLTYGGPLNHRSNYNSLKKFYDRSRIAEAKQNDGTANFTVIRLAEMHLIDAECTHMLGGTDADVYKALEPLWKRAFDKLSDADVYKPAGGVDIDFIIDEYDREVGFECNTYFILKRTHTLLERLAACPVSKEVAKTAEVQKRDLVKDYGKNLYIRPFPSSIAAKFVGLTREMLPPGYDYGNQFDAPAAE
ncbi:MAG: RagB/SusD family nutrient uptake outer membrane protein [Bacteroidales bacterium]|nr:RagB/SusD family nutrient uptake outer membrane protein [Bacteroidales bacterium]